MLAIAGYYTALAIHAGHPLGHVMRRWSSLVLVCAAGWAARFGSGLFLIIQMIILLDFTQSWNDTWVKNGEDDERWLYGLLGLTVTSFLGVLGIAGQC